MYNLRMRKYNTIILVIIVYSNEQKKKKTLKMWGGFNFIYFLFLNSLKHARGGKLISFNFFFLSTNIFLHFIINILYCIICIFFFLSTFQCFNIVIFLSLFFLSFFIISQEEVTRLVIITSSYSGSRCRSGWRRRRQVERVKRKWMVNVEKEKKEENTSEEKEKIENENLPPC